MLFLTIHQVQNYTFFLIYANVYGTFFELFYAFSCRFQKYYLSLHREFRMSNE
jgi:hypothetical protein